MFEHDYALVNDFKKLNNYIQDILSSYPLKKLENIIPIDKIKNVRRVLLTGNGDSYIACLATENFLRKMFDISDVYTLRCSDLARHYYFSKTEDPNQTLVIAVSMSGSGARAVEVLERFNKRGALTMGISIKDESLLAKTAQFPFKETGEKIFDFSYSDQPFTYINAQLNLILLGLYAGVSREVISLQQEQQYRQDILDYAHQFSQHLEAIDEIIYKFVDKYHACESFDFMSSGNDLASAYLGVSKVIEYSGHLAIFNDCEQWSHESFFIREREKMITSVLANKDNNGLSRIKETINSMLVAQSNVLVISDLDCGQFDNCVDYCQIVTCKQAEFNPLLDFIPFNLLAFHYARYHHLGFFICDEAPWVGPRFPIYDVNQNKSSERIYFE